MAVNLRVVLSPSSLLGKGGMGSAEGVWGGGVWEETG